MPNSHLIPYALGATQVVIGLSATVSIIPQPFQNGFVIKKLSAGGTLSIVQGPSAVLGYALGDTESFRIEGPARFYLAAAGATATVGIVATYSDGYSALLQP